MSTFRVKLTQGDARTGGGNLDENAQDNTYSIQRTIYAMGPNKINRKLNDGDTFTDCNYWKRFAYPQVALNEAFIEVVTDDGSVYVDGQQSTSVRSYSRTIAAGSTFTTTNNIIDILGDTGNVATWAIITVTGDELVCRVNDDTNSDFTISASTSHTFNTGDVLIETLKFGNSESGSAEATLSVVAGVISRCYS